MRRLTALLALVLSMSMIHVAPVSASAPSISPPIIQGLAGPLGLAVGPGEQIYVSQAFAGLLTGWHNGTTRIVASSTDPNATIAGVAVRGRGPATFTMSGYNPEIDDYIGLVMRVRPNGTTKLIGDPGTYEETMNPDGVNSYGFVGLSEECAAQVPDEVGGFPYAGGVDSNSYAIEVLADGSMMIADAGGNDIVRLGVNGAVSLVAVLPPMPAILDANAAALFGLPDCVIGETYNFEPVPTDVEMGPDGMLYVSSLPGGPEDASLGARGSVFKVNPSNGAVTLVASGFLGAVDLAVAPDGTIYVAELFGDQISMISGGATSVFTEISQPGAVEWFEGKLYSTMDVFGNGSVVRITP